MFFEDFSPGCPVYDYDRSFKQGFIYNRIGETRDNQMVATQI